MKKLLSAVLALALCAPAFAQRSPKIEQSITAGDVTMSLNYTSIAYNKGETVKALMSEEGGDMRKMVNDRATSRPIATFKSSVDVKCGELTLPAGEHQVYFTIDEERKWTMNFKMGDKVQSMKLALTDAGDHLAKQLLMCLYAGDNGGAGVYLAFGTMQTMLSFEPAGGAKAGNTK